MSKFTELLKETWQLIDGRDPEVDELSVVLKLTTVLAYDFDGADRAVASASLHDSVEDPNEANATFAVHVQDLSARFMSGRVSRNIFRPHKK